MRLNPLRTAEGVRDLAHLTSGPPLADGLLVLTKANDPEEIVILDDLLTEHGSALGLVPLIETARGLDAVMEIALASARTVALLFGAVDLAAELGVAVAHEPLLYARSRIVLAARRAAVGADGKPVNLHALGSMMGLTGVLMALLRRTETRRGEHIDISMQDATMSWLPNVTGSLFADGRAPDVPSMRTLGGAAFFSLYETSDSRCVAFGGVERKFVAAALTALGRPDLIEQAMAPPGPAQSPVKAFLAATMRTRTRDAWDAFFAGMDVCFAPVLDLKEALA